MERQNPNYRDGLLLRSTSHHTTETRSLSTTSSDFVLRWGSRKRSRCMKVQFKNKDNHNHSRHNTAEPSALAPTRRTTGRVDRRVFRSTTSAAGDTNGCMKPHQQPSSPSHRVRRNCESSIGMRGQSNGAKGGLSSAEGVGAQDKGGGSKGQTAQHTNHNDKKSNHHNHKNDCGSGCRSSEKGWSPGNEAVWLPKFMISLTNKEKEEDFMAIKGSKLPTRPKKRAKFVQRTLNFVSPGAWLCDLTIERYEVREKKIIKKRPRGLKAMGSIDSDSE